MSNLNVIEALTQNIDQFKMMKESLDQDIARAAMACVKAGDATLMQQLVGSVPQGHEFSPMLIQLALEMRSTTTEAKPVNVDVAAVYKDIACLVRDVTEGHTNKLYLASRERLALFEVALELLPAESLPRLAEAIEGHLKNQQEDGVYGHVPAAYVEKLRSIQASGELI